MKTLIIISALFISITMSGQNPYDRLKGEFRTLFDPIPIDKEQKAGFFKYAVTLYKQDSLRKAGQIFDRIYWLDTASTLGRQSLQYRKQIEDNVIKKTQANLYNTWSLSWSGTNWGPMDSTSKSNNTKKIQLDSNTIRFYHNDTLVRQTKYTLTQTFAWIGGYLANHIQYEDNQEQWYFNLASLNGFSSDRLLIEEKSKYLCGNYFECYLLVKDKNGILALTRENE